MKTKKCIAVSTTACLLLISPLAYAQQSNTDAFGKGTNVIGLGIGLGGDYTYIGDGYTATPNFVITYDNGTFGNVGPGTISLGAILSYKGASYNYVDPYSGYYYDQKWIYYIVGIRSAYHWNFTTSSRFDPYAGIMLGYYDLGYRISSSDPYYKAPGNPHYYYYADTYSSYMAFSIYLGARYYLSNKVGIWLELGYGYSDAAFGVSFKF